MSGIFLILIFLPLKSYANFIIGNFDYISGRFKKVADYMKNSPTLALLFRRIRSAKAIRSGLFGVRCSTRATISTSRPEVFVESRRARNRFGNKSIDDGNYLFTLDEMKDFVAREPAAAKYFRPWYGAREFINNEPRYCLWPGYCPSNELRKRSLAYRRVKIVRDFRLAGKSAGNRKFADKLSRFHVENFLNAVDTFRLSSWAKTKYFQMRQFFRGRSPVDNSATKNGTDGSEDFGRAGEVFRSDVCRSVRRSDHARRPSRCSQEKTTALLRPLTVLKTFWTTSRLSLSC